MNTIKQITLIVLLLITYNVGFSQETLTTIKNKYNSLLKDQQEGVAVLIKKETKIHHLSLGNSNLDSDKVFNIGSATKTFTAILIMQEVEKGNLKLTDEIGTYLNQINNVDSSLTIQTLLTHESGLDEVVGKNIQDIFYANKDSIYNNTHLLNEVEKNNTNQIGKFIYCNTNYLLLGKILENINDQSYFDLLRVRIIEPLQLTNTYPYVSKNISNLATPFHEGKDVTSYLDYRYFTNIANAAGSIASTLNDMEKFYTSLFETNILLKKATVKQMIQSGNNFYGFGIMKEELNNTSFYGHGGNNIGYSFRNGYNPKTKALFLLFSNTKSIPYQKMIQDDILMFLNGKEVLSNNTINLDIFKQYVGSFLLKEANINFNILLQEDKMFLEVKEQGVKSQLFQKDKNTLFDAVVGATFSIIKDNDNAMTFSQNGFVTTINRVKK